MNAAHLAKERFDCLIAAAAIFDALCRLMPNSYVTVTADENLGVAVYCARTTSGLILAMQKVIDLATAGHCANGIAERVARELGRQLERYP